MGNRNDRLGQRRVVAIMWNTLNETAIYLEGIQGILLETGQ